MITHKTLEIKKGRENGTTNRNGRLKNKGATCNKTSSWAYNTKQVGQLSETANKILLASKA